MITVEDLMKWANDHAVGRSISVPKGWIQSEDLIQLAREIERCNPFQWPYQYSPNYKLPNSKELL